MPRVIETRKIWADETAPPTPEVAADDEVGPEDATPDLPGRPEEDGGGAAC